MKRIIIAALLAASLTGCASASCDNAYDPKVCRDAAPAMQSNFGSAMAAALAGGAAALQQQPQYVPPPPPRNLNCRVYGNNNIQCN